MYVMCVVCMEWQMGVRVVHLKLSTPPRHHKVWCGSLNESALDLVLMMKNRWKLMVADEESVGDAHFSSIKRSLSS